MTSEESGPPLASVGGAHLSKWGTGQAGTQMVLSQLGIPKAVCLPGTRVL